MWRTQAADELAGSPALATPFSTRSSNPVEGDAARPTLPGEQELAR